MVIGWSATLHVGSEMVAGRPASLASAAIAVGFMSAEPVIASSFRLSETVERPFTPMTIATTPNTINTAAAMKPP